MEKAYLKNIREIQSVTGPNMCLASSKFLALKLLGFVDAKKHLWDFLRSGWARKHSSLPLSSYWGASMALYNGDFNKVALPAAINDPSAGVKAPGTGRIRLHKGFVYFSNRGTADTMLVQRTPLVVGVSIHGGRERDHFIVIFKDGPGKTWAIDPWPGDPEDAVADLGTDFSFSKQTKLHMTADDAVTEIPCGTPFFGYFQ